MIRITPPALRVTPAAALLPAIIFILGAWELALLCAVAVLIHELGHYAALRLCGGTAGEIRICLTGVAMEYDNLSYGGEIITAMAGPVASLVLALISSLFGRIFGVDSAYRLAGLSLIFAVFNMLPVFPLDGGRAVFAAVAYLFGIDAAETTRSVLTAAFGTALIFFGAVLLRVSGNPTLLLAAACLVGGAVRARLRYSGAAVIPRGAPRVSREFRADAT
ncbi:MAG: site-2 protease family protein [Oscillospiraceae bacterium]|jgi:Zn-dependent protease|nr:site-2 protease family protein [Oscillospiraceae bacterium]